MFVLKGFVTHALFANNVPGQIAAIGELSTEARTYSREKGYYVSAPAVDLTLVSFLSATDGVKRALAVEESDHVLTLAKWIYDQTTTSSNPVYADELLLELVQVFDAVAENFECGLVVNADGSYMPEWVSWESKTIAGENRIKLWFVDASFRAQYDEYEIIVVPPLDNLNHFFRTGTMVENDLSAITISAMADKIQLAKGNQPETIVRVDTYEYIDPLNNLHRVLSHWGLLIHGLAGNNIDSIKDALVAYILANSTYTREQWTVILPDIFKRTEFLLIPMWNQYGIPNRTLEAGIHSPIVNLTSALAFVRDIVESYSELHINNHTSVMGHPYKSLAMLSIGSPENRNDWFRIVDVFPDYLAVSSTSIDFNRMALATQNWLIMIAEMLLAAEVMGEYTDIPVGMTRAKRDGVLYLVKNYQNIQYLMAAKSNAIFDVVEAP